MPFSVPYTFVPFTTIYSDQANSNFSHLVNDGNTHEVATTGVHGVGVGQIVGTTLTQTLTNKTINGGALSGTFAGTPTYSGLSTFNAGITLPTTQHVNFNVGGTSFITESSANTIQIVTNSTLGMQIDASNVAIGNRALAIQSTQRLYLDGGGDTFFSESSANVVTLTTGGTDRLQASSSGVFALNAPLGVQPTQRVYIDGGGNTFIDEVSSDNLRFTIGGNDALRMQRVNATLVNFGFNGNGTNPEALFSGADVVIGNVTDATTRILVLQTTASNACGLYFSHALNSATSSISHSGSSGLLTIQNSTGSNIRMTSISAGIDFHVNGHFNEMNLNGELKLEDQASPSSIEYASQRSFAKAWAFVTAATATINLAFNIASVTRTSAGSFSVVFTAGFADANYSIGMFAESASRVQINSRTTSGFNLVTLNSAGTALDFDFNFQIFGT